MKKRHASQLSRADMLSRLASQRAQLYQLEVDLAMGLFEGKDPQEYEALFAQLRDEIRRLEDSLRQLEP